jgi:hypothetical protein
VAERFTRRIRTGNEGADVEIWYEGRCVARQERSFSERLKILSLEDYTGRAGEEPRVLAGCSSYDPIDV